MAVCQAEFNLEKNKQREQQLETKKKIIKPVPVYNFD